MDMLENEHCRRSPNYLRIDYMGCWERFLNWLSLANVPDSEKSIMRDLITIGIVEKE